jgi:hypothetical protein
VTYDNASVILTEENERLFVAREAPPAAMNRPVITLGAKDNAVLKRVLVLKRAVCPVSAFWTWREIGTELGQIVNAVESFS